MDEGRLKNFILTILQAGPQFAKLHNRIAVYKGSASVLF